MTWICWKGIELSARSQVLLLGTELVVLALFAVDRPVEGVRATASAARRSTASPTTR